jgi:hypothetical protein
MNSRNEPGPFRIRIPRTLELPCHKYRREIPENSENCHLTSFRINISNAGDDIDQVMVRLICSSPVRMGSLVANVFLCFFFPLFSLRFS